MTSSLPGWDFACLDLIQVMCLVSQLLSAHIYNCPVVSRKCCSAMVKSSWLLLYFYLLFHNDPRSLGRESVYDIDVHLGLRIPPFLNLLGLRREASLMRLEKGTYLWI